MVLAVVMCGLLWPAGARADAPANDDFADAQALVTGVAATGDTSEASAEDGEPAHSAANGPNRSVWFTWTPESGGLARTSACGSGCDPVVAVYGGSALQGIFFSKLANNDDGCGVDSTSMVHLRVTAGVTYRVVLDGWGSGDAGAYSMDADVLGDPGQPPANDDLDHEFGVTGTHVHATGTNVGATSGWNEWPASGPQLVWWRWASPVSGQVHVDTCASGFDTILGVVRRSEGIWAGGESAGGGCGDGGTRGMVTFNAIEDVEYWIGVGGEAGTTGAIDLRIDAGSDITPPVTTITAGPGATWDRYVARI